MGSYTKGGLKASQPKGLYLMCALQMWEAFSYFGMRAILVLYMISILGFDDASAYGVYAVYIALVEGLGIFGGKIGDKYLGLRNSIVFGGMMIAAGHIVLSLPIDACVSLYLGLAFIAVGTGIFKTNLNVLLGEFYEKEDPRKDSGYTYYYVGMNFGGLLATILCAYVATSYGWHYGFGMAALGMFLGLTLLYKFRRIIGNRGARPKSSSAAAAYSIKVAILAFVPIAALLIYSHEITTPLLFMLVIGSFVYTIMVAKKLPKVDRHHVYSILVSILFLAIFYTFEEQIGSLLIVFAERFGEKDFYGVTVLPQSLTSVNPAVILVLGPILGYLLELYERKTGRGMNVLSKIAISFALLGGCFAILYYNAHESEKMSITIIALAFASMAIGELFIGPVVYSHASSKAPDSMKGLMMGMVLVGFSLANTMSGVVAKSMAITDSSASAIAIYSNGFLNIAIFAAVMVALLLSLRLVKAMRD